jgi:hypothetical protein
MVILSSDNASGRVVLQVGLGKSDTSGRDNYMFFARTAN